MLIQMKRILLDLKNRRATILLKIWKFILIFNLLILVFCCIITVFCTENRLFVRARKNNSEEENNSVMKTDAFIINTYYYPESKSLGKNAVGIILLMNNNTQTNLSSFRMKLVATDVLNHTVTVVPILLRDSLSNCTYINMVATANVLPEMTKLEIHDGEHRMEIPYRLGKTSAPAPVIICISPQFVAEQWQQFVAQAHITRHFGGHLHMYITSMIDSFFDLVQEYEKLGYVTIDFWIKTKFGNITDDSEDPMYGTEMRNQAGAYSDCLYQYKEAASFITFFDLDDILISRKHASYFEEFSAMYEFLPQFSTFQFARREMLTYNKIKMQDINLVELFGHTWFVNEESYGKMISRPENLNSMWIHQSLNIPAEKHHVSKSNYIVHMHKPIEGDGTDPIPYIISNFVKLNSMQVNKTILLPIQRDFKRVMNSFKVSKISKKLKPGTYYFRSIYRCYYENLYKNPNIAICPNGQDCQIPLWPNLNCVEGKARYKSGPAMWPVTYHYQTNPTWSRTHGCYA